MFIGVKNNIINTQVPELTTDCESIWVRINIAGSKSLHVGAFYRPPGSDESNLEELNTALSRVDTRKNMVILGGDFNLPDIDWETTTTNPTKEPSKHHQLLDTAADHNLEQVVKSPTRDKNILDLIFTTHANLMRNVKTIPGIGDHDCVYCEYDIAPKTATCQPKRTIPLYKKKKLGRNERVHEQL